MAHFLFAFWVGFATGYTVIGVATWTYDYVRAR